MWSHNICFLHHGKVCSQVFHMCTLGPFRKYCFQLPVHIMYPCDNTIFFGNVIFVWLVIDKQQYFHMHQGQTCNHSEKAGEDEVRLTESGRRSRNSSFPKMFVVRVCRSLGCRDSGLVGCESISTGCVDVEISPFMTSRKCVAKASCCTDRRDSVCWASLISWSQVIDSGTDGSAFKWMIGTRTAWNIE